MLSLHHIKSPRNCKKSHRILKIKPFINRYDWKGTNYLSGKDDGKHLRKVIQQFLLLCCMFKKMKRKFLILMTKTSILDAFYVLHDTYYKDTFFLIL